MRSSRRGSSQRSGSFRPLWHRPRAASALGPASLPFRASPSERVRQPVPFRSRELARAVRPAPLPCARRGQETARRNPRLVGTQDRRHTQRDDANAARRRATNRVVAPARPSVLGSRQSSSPASSLAASGELLTSDRMQRETAGPRRMGANQPAPSSHATHHRATATDEVASGFLIGYQIREIPLISRDGGIRTRDLLLPKQAR